LNIIDYNHPCQAEECCNAVWDQWLDMDTAATWSKVIEAVDSPAVVSVTHKAAVISDNSMLESVPVPVTNARIQLQKFYIQERYKVSEDDWPSYQPEHFTSVALIHHREKHVTTREVIAIANVLHKGKVNVGYVSEESHQEESSYLHYSDSRITTNIAEIFLKLTTSSTEEGTIQAEPRVILIEGSPGIGKTILSKEIAFQWAKNKMLAQKSLLFLIFLRDPYLQQVETLEHFVCYVINSAQKNSLVLAIEQYLEETSGEDCMIIFDGYDEVSEEVRCNSFISKLINRKVLKLCSLVITSRPTTSAVLHGIADRRVEILGFTKEDRNRYLHQSLEGNIDQIRKIEEYFEANPFIDSLCYIPLNMTILICILKTSQGTNTGLPKTQTEINKQFTFVTIARYLNRNHNLTLPVKLLQCLPLPYKEQLASLAKLAFTFLDKDKIVFNDDDIATDCPDCVGKWNSLGLLKIVKYYNFIEDSTNFSYNFLHFSIQEFLAAYYITSLNDKKQSKTLKDAFWKPRYLNTGIMYFGLTRGNSFALRHFLSGHKSIFFSRLFGAKHIRRRVSEDKVKCLHLFHCFLEAGNDKLVQRVGKFLLDDAIDISNNALLHKDILMLNFFLIRSANKKWKLIDLSSCYIGDQGFDIFTRSFSECIKNKTTIETVNISSNHLTSLSVTGIINLILCFQVRKLILCNNNFDYQAFNDELLSKFIVDNKVVKMVIEKVENYESNLYIVNCKFDVKKDIALCTPNVNCSVYLWNAGFQVCDASTLASSSHMLFTCVSVYEDFLSSCEQAVQIASKLQELCALGKYQVEYILQSNTNIFAFNTKLKHVTQALNSKHPLQYDGIKQADNAQCKNFDLYKCSIRDAGLQAIMSQFVKQDRVIHFDTFNISRCILTELSIKTIVDFLKNFIIRNLILSDNSISNSLLYDAILSEICSSQNKILNHKNQISLTIFNNNEKMVSGNESEPIYSVTKCLFNCHIDDDIVTSAENSFVSFALFIYGVKLSTENFDKLTLLCENSYLQMDVFLFDIHKDLQTKIVSMLQSSNKSQYSYVLTSESKLMAYKARQESITEGLNFNPLISELHVANCKLSWSEFDSLKSIFNQSPMRWDTIDLSGCNLGDKGCEEFCLSFLNCKVHIKTLNLSDNSLTLSSVSFITKFLQYCVVEKLIVSQNELSYEDFFTSLTNQYSSNITIMNFISKVPLQIIVSLQDTGIPCIISCLYLTRSLFDSRSLGNSSDENGRMYNIYLVDDLMKNINVVLLYSDSELKIKHILKRDLNMLQEMVRSIKNKHSIIDIDMSSSKMDDLHCSVLCNELFSPISILKNIRQLNLSGNNLTLSCIDSVMKSLQHCVIQQIIISENYIKNEELTDAILLEWFSNSTNYNLKLGIPLLVINNSLIKSHYCATVIMNNVCINEYINEMFITDFYPITECSLFFSHSDIMIDELINLFPLFCNKLPQNTKFILHETDLTDAVAEKITDLFTVNFKKYVEYVITSKTKVIVHKFSYPLTCINLMTNPSITTLKIEGCCIVDTDHFKAMLNQGPNYWKCIDLSGCHIRDEGLHLLCDSFSSKLCVYIENLNLSDNNLTLSSVNAIIKLLCHCIIEHLIITGNDFDNCKFNNALCMQQCTSQNVMNLVNAVPLVVRNTVSGKSITACNIYFNANEATDKVWCLVIDNSAECYYIYYFDGKIRTALSFENKNMSGIISQISESTLPMLMKSINFIFERKVQETIDLTQYNFDNKTFSMVCTMLFNKNSLLRHVHTLILTSNRLSLDCISDFVDCLKYCCIDCIIIYENNPVEDFAETFTELLFKRCRVQRRILSSILRKSITLINYTRLCRGVLVKYATTYFVNFVETGNFTKVVDSLSDQYDVEIHKVVLINFLSKNNTSVCLNFLQLILQKSTIVNLIVYDVGLKDKTLLTTVDTFQTMIERVEYILTSNTLCMVYRSKENNIFPAMLSNILIDTFVLERCVLSREALARIGFTLSTKMKHLKRITLSNCSVYLNDTFYQEFSRNFFHNVSMIHYLRKLDISNNHITLSCVDTITSSLQSCIIEKLVISDIQLSNELNKSVFLAGYQGRSGIRNFVNGVPLSIINVAQGNSMTDSFTVFAIKCAIDDYSVKLLSDFSDCHVSYYNLFILNCSSKNYFNYAKSVQKLLRLNVSNFTIFAPDLAVEVVNVISNCLTKLSTVNTEHFLMSAMNPITNLSNMTSTSNSQLINIIGYEQLFNMFCQYSLCNVAHITQLNISAYQLTPFCVNTLINSLQFCSVETVSLLNNNNILDKVTDALLEAYCSEKKIKNLILGNSLTLVGYTEVNECTEIWARLFFINGCESRQKLFSLLKNEKYAQIQCVFINFFNNNSVFASKKFLLDFLTKNCHSVIIYEVGLQDEIATNIIEQLLPTLERVQYVMTTPKMFLTFRATVSLITKALADSLYTTTTKLKECMVYADRLSDIKSTFFKHIKQLTLIQCNDCDEKYKQLSGLLFISTCIISYLQTLDISHSNLSVGTIIESLQSCVIEKLIVTGVKNEMTNHIFNSAYYGKQDILNFVKGVPLIVINCSDEIATTVTAVIVFVVNANINNYTVNKITQIPGYDIYSYSLYLFSNNLLTSNLNLYCFVKPFFQLLSSVAEFKLFGLNLKDNLAVEISSHLNAMIATDIEYYLISETKLLSNVPSVLPISRWLSTNPVTHILGSNTGEEIFITFCNSLCNHSCYIKEIDISSYLLTSRCIQSLVDSLQYCCVEKLMIMNKGNKLFEITDAVIDSYHAGKMLRNSISGVPLTVLAFTKQNNCSDTWANLHFVDFVANEKFEMMLCNACVDVNCTQLHCIFLNFFKRNQRILQNKVISSFLVDYCTNIVIYEVGLEDKVAVEIAENLKAAFYQVKYVLVSNTMLQAFRTDLVPIADALAQNLFISTIKLKFIDFYENLAYMGLILSSISKCLRNLSITQSDIDNEKYEQFSKSLFNEKSVISYLKELDISHNNIVCSSVLIQSLHSCVVEKLVVSDVNMCYDFSTSIFLNAFYEDKVILNFTTGVPLIIVNNLQRTDKLVIHEDENCCEIFLINTLVSEHIVTLITDVSGQNISDYSVFVKNNALLCDLDHLLSKFYNLFQSTKHFTLFGTDLMDEVALKIARCLAISVNTDVKYFLLSDEKLRTNTTSTQLMCRKIDNNGLTQIPDVLKELTGLFCKSLSYSEKFLNHFDCLDLSSFELSSNYTELLVDSFQYCCIKKLIVWNTTQSVDIINDQIFAHYFEGKKLLNTTSEIPLIIFGRTYTESYHFEEIHVYFLDILITDEIFENIIKENYYELHYVFLNAFQDTSILPNKMILSILEKPLNSIFVCDFGFKSENILAITDQIKTTSQQVPYVLISKSIVFAYKADIRSILNALVYNTVVTTVELTECVISTYEFGLIFNARLRLLKNICFHQCSVGGLTHKSVLFRHSLLHSGAAIVYLKQMDLSTSTLDLALSCSSTILTILRSSIIEKIVLSNHNIADELVSAIFQSAYCKNPEIFNFIVGVPLIVINNIKIKNSLTDASNFVVFLMNIELNKVVDLITDVSGYNVYSYKLFLMGNNVVTNLAYAFSQFRHLLQRLTNVSIFGANVMDKLAWKIATFVSEISNVDIEFSLICENTLLTKVKDFQPIMRSLTSGKISQLKEFVSILPFTQVSYLDLVDISGCNLNSEEFLVFHKFLLQFCTAIKVLNISSNNISLLALSKAIIDFHIQKLYLYGQTQITLTALLPSLMNILTNNLEIEYSESTSYILCDVQPDINDSLNAIYSLQNLLHFCMLNCSTKKKNILLNTVVPALSIIQITNIHFYNNSLLPEDIITVLENLMHVNLFIKEPDIHFRSFLCDGKLWESKKNMYYTSEVCSNVQVHWTSTLTKTEMKQVEFHFKNPSVIKYGVIMSQRFLTEQNINLYSIRIANCYATDQIAKDFTAISDNSSALECIELINLNLSDNNLIIIFQLLRKIYSLKHLVVHNINISAKTCADHIPYVIANNKGLQHLKISSCNLKESAIVEIVNAMNGSNSLQHLDLSNNIISNMAAGKLASTLNTINNLKHLDLSSTVLQEASIIDIMRSIYDASLEYLSLNNCIVTRIAATEIASCALANSKDFKILNLSNCRMEEASLLCIVAALIKISSLSILDLSLNTITESVAHQLDKVIRNNLGITNLSLTVLDECIVKVASFCKPLSLLTSIHISFPFFGTKFGHFDKHCLDDIIFKAVKMDEFTNYYVSVESNTKEITHLSYRNCGCKEMFSCLVSLSSLQHLDLNSSRIDYQVISSAIKSNVCLKLINVSNCIWEGTIDDVLHAEMFYEIMESLSLLRQLEYINISGNRITNQIADLLAFTIVSNKQLKHLDLCRCQVPTSGLLAIIKALASINNLSYLDMSYNYFSRTAAKEFVEVITNNTGMMELNVSNCKLNEEVFVFNKKSLQHLTQLRCLNLSKNFLRGDIIPTFKMFLASSVCMQHLDISDCKVTKEGMQTITSSLKMINSLKHLDISYCTINCSSAADNLSTALLCNTRLEHLNLANCLVQNTSIIKILKALEQIHSLKYLNLKSNFWHKSVSSTVVKSLASVINSNSSLEYMGFSNCRLLGTEVTCIMQAICGLSHLQHLDLSHNVITYEAAVRVASVITNNPSLQHVYMKDCDIEEYGIETISGTLLLSKNLISLDLSTNYVTKAAAKAIVGTICNSALLEHLNLSHCSLGDFNLCDIILDCFGSLKCAIKYLDLQSNQISYYAAMNLASFLDKNCLIEYLNLSKCMLSEQSLLTVLYSVEEIGSLCYLNLGANKVTKGSVPVLANIIKNNIKLKHLLVPRCDKSGHLVTEIIQYCGTLEYLDISGNALTDFAVHKLSNIVNESASLQCLNINKCTITSCGREIIIKTIADISCLQTLSSSVNEDPREGVSAAVVSNSVLFIFCLSENQLLADWNNYKIIEPMWYINFKPYHITEKGSSSQTVVSAFSSAKLMHLRISGCNLREYSSIVTLDAAKHIGTLQYLILRSCRIPPEVTNDLILTILHNAHIKHFDVCDCEMSGSEVAVIAEALNELSTLQFLDMSYNEITDQAVIKIASVITNNHLLKHLNLSGCCLKDFGIEIIFNALAHTNFLLSLNISENHITSKVAKNVNIGLFSNYTLRNILFSHCFTEEALSTVLSFVKKTITSLEHLDLSGSFIADETADDISVLLTSNSILHLNISNCNASNVGMFKLLYTLEQECITLQSLILSCNRLNDGLAGKVISIMKHLTYLDVSKCGLSQHQVMLLIKVAFTIPHTVQYLDLSYNDKVETLPTERNDIKQCTTVNNALNHLNLCCCGLVDNDMNAVLLLLTRCTSLTYLNVQLCTVSNGAILGLIITKNKNSLNYLNLSDCKLQETDINAIAENLKQTQSIEHLLLSSNVISDRAAKNISSTLHKFYSLRQLSLSDCDLSDLGVFHIANSLKFASLQHLDLSHSTISDKAAVSIASALSNNSSSLEYLNMSYCAWHNHAFATVNKVLDLEYFTKLKETDFTTV